ncbi:uncharacterized protein LOC121882145 [Thunnus maccoyii]|uniref:uncharacterized protein LOC121882145 n=1 Tax=Thunnus maccoyii TaxID=8240 RepID=UPI001C4C5E7E|nr:uncharacterized protein LOC121882145 [Thunnus maccoyii]
MTLLELILILVLQFEGISGADIFPYHRPGDEAILPCDDVSSSDRVCSRVYWLHSRDPSQTFDLVQNGNVNKSARAARLSLDTNCSLVINNITAEDAGLYTCQQSDKEDINVHLSIMTILPSPPDADAKRDGNVTLECSLLRYSQFGCRPNSFRWVDETGTVLLGEGVGYEIIGQTDCVSVLTVKRQSGHNRRFTCQWINKNNKVRIEAHYTPVFTEGINDDQPEKSNTGCTTDWSPLDYVMLTLRIAGLLLITVIVVLLIKGRGNKTPPDENNEHDDGDEVKYENVEAPSAAT